MTIVVDVEGRRIRAGVSDLLGEPEQRTIGLTGTGKLTKRDEEMVDDRGQITDSRLIVAAVVSVTHPAFATDGHGRRPAFQAGHHPPERFPLEVAVEAVRMGTVGTARTVVDGTPVVAPTLMNQNGKEVI